MPTIRNARGFDLIVTDGDETIFFGVQSKTLSKRQAVPLGLALEGLGSDWWVITVKANSDAPTCFIMTGDEVRQFAAQDKNGGRFWLEPRDYDKDEYRNAWEGIGAVENGKR